MSNYGILALLLQSSLLMLTSGVQSGILCCAVLRSLWNFTLIGKMMRVVQCDRGTLWCGFVDVRGVRGCVIGTGRLVLLGSEMWEVSMGWECR